MAEVPALPWALEPEAIEARHVDAFCAALAETGSVDLACERAHVLQDAMRAQVEGDAARAKRVGLAMQRGRAKLVELAWQRAVVGWEEPVMSRGQPCIGWWDTRNARWAEVERNDRAQKAAEANPDLERRVVTHRAYDRALFQRLLDPKDPLFHTRSPKAQAMAAAIEGTGEEDGAQAAGIEFPGLLSEEAFQAAHAPGKEAK